MANIISRRTVATGAAWAVPAITMASTVPSYALSTCSGCATLKWSTWTNTFSGLQGGGDVGNGPGTQTAKRVGSITFAGSCTPTVTVTQQRNAGRGLVGSSKTGVSTAVSGTQYPYGDFSISNMMYTRDNKVWEDPLLSEFVPVGLMMNHSRGTTTGVKASETITFDFGVPVNTVKFKIYDFTRSTYYQSTDYYNVYRNHTDRIGLNVSATVTNIGGSSLLGSGTYSNPWYRSKSSDPSDLLTHKDIEITASLNSATSFSLQYSQPDTSVYSGSTHANVQFVVIGDMEICL